MISKVVMLLFNDLKRKFHLILLFRALFGSGRQRLSVHLPLSDVPKNEREADVLLAVIPMYLLPHSSQVAKYTTCDRWQMVGVEHNLLLHAVVGPVGRRLFWSGPTMSSLDDWLVGQGSRICNCLTPSFRRVAHIGLKVRTNPPSSAKFRLFCFLFAYERALSCHHTTSPQLKQSIWADSKAFVLERVDKHWQSARRRTTLSLLEVNLWLNPVLFPGSTGAYLQEEVRARASQIPTSRIFEERKRSYRQDWASPSRSAFWTTCQRRFKAKWLTYSASEDGGEKQKEMFLCTMRSVSQKSWSSLQCWAVDHEAYDQLDKSFNNPEGKTLSAKRTETVLGTLHSCKRMTPALQELNDVKRWLDMAEQTGLTWKFWPK